MRRSRLLLVVASIFVGTAIVFVLLGAIYNLFLAAVALPFGAAGYVIWRDATGRLRIRWRRPSGRPESSGRRATRGPRAGQSRYARQARSDGGGRQVGRDEPSVSTMDRRRALRILGVAEEADAATIRQAYRERTKAAHPDTEGGSEESFKRVSDAYETLTDPDTR